MRANNLRPSWKMFRSAPEPGEFWYRVDDQPGSPHLYERRVRVLKHTPRGVWVDGYGLARFVLRDARKRWACPTPEEARESFLARKRRQRAILRAQLAHVEAVIEQAEREHSVPA